MIIRLAWSRRLLVRWTDLVQRFAVAVLVVCVGLTGLSLAYVAGNFAINTSTADMLSPDLPFQQLEKELDEAFPLDVDTIAVVVEGPTPDLADEKARALTEHLRRRPDLFRSVHDLAGSPFFRRNGLLFLGSEELYEMGDRLAEAQPFLGALSRDPSLRGLFELLDLAADHALEDKDGAGFAITPVFDAITEVAEAQVRGERQRLSWRRLMTGDEAASVYRRVFLVQPVLDFGSFRPAGAAISALRSLGAAIAPDAGDGVRVRLTGTIALNDDELQSVTIGIGAAGTVSLVLVITLLLLCYRSPRLLLASLITLIVGLIWTAAFAVAAIGALNLISLAFAVLFIGLGADFSIHYVLRYRETREFLDGHAAALRSSVRSVAGALTLSAIAAAIGFFSFLPTDYVGLAELGLIAGAGMVIALVVTFTVLPAVMTVLRPRLRREVPWEISRQAAFAAWVRDHRRSILWSSLALGLLALAAAPMARFDFDPINLKDRDSESVSTLLAVMTEDPTTAYAITVLARDLHDAESFSRRIDDLDVVHSVRTLASFVPDDQEEKLDIIASLALVLEPSLTAPRQPPPTEAETVRAFRRLQDSLRRLAASGGETAAAAERLRVALASVMRQRIQVPEALRDLAVRLLSGLPGELESLRLSLTAEPVTLASLPEELTARWIAADGRARLEIYPREHVHGDDAALARFVETVQTVVPEATGTPVVVHAAGQAVVRALIEAAAVAVVAIALLLLVLLKRPRDVLIVFAPLMLAALLTVAASLLIGIPFNFANVIVLPLLFGLGVAGSLHLVIREGKEGGDAKAMTTSTPRAVLYTSLTTIASFGSLALSHHPGTAGMGILLTVAIVLTLVCTLIVLPALMAIAGRNG